MEQYKLQASLEYDQFGNPLDKSYGWKRVEAPILGARAADRRRGAGVERGTNWNIKKRPVFPTRSRESVMGAGEEFNRQQAAIRLRGMSQAERHEGRQELKRQITHLKEMIGRDQGVSPEQIL
jgi:hypothetical protein